MDARLDDGAFPALFRMLQAGARGAECALFVVAQGRTRAWVRTPGFDAGAIDPFPDAWRPVDDSLAVSLAAGTTTLLDGAVLGLEAENCALQPLRGEDGAVTAFLVLTGGRTRRLGPGLRAALRDAAAVAEPLLAASGVRPAPPAAAFPVPRAHAAASTRAAIFEMIDVARSGAEPSWSLFLVDLDRFQAVNAALGDAAGDALLAAIGARFEARLRPRDRMARLEADRFLVLAARRPEKAGGFAAGLLAAARRPLTLAGRSVTIQASIGVVAGLAPDASIAAAVMEAEAALRQAKAEGRNRYVIHEPWRAAAALETSQLELDLAEAPGRGQMRLVYQPYLDLGTGRASGAEALLRWRHPTRGELAPASFIPLAESTGLILPLGAWALRAALAAARRWPERLAVSVNVSALQFHQPGFVAEVEAALAASGVAPNRLELEITETVLMRDNPETTAQLEALIARGVRIALDDFGTGYSALAYLARLPHHRIKLDRSFVHDLGNPATVELVRAIIALATATGVTVTAEGVERPDQIETVRALGFTHAQGYATGRPVADPIEMTDAAETAV